jgi:kumamolisin
LQSALTRLIRRNLNPQLHPPAPRAAICRDITAGNADGDTGRPGRDACTGWGSPLGEQLRQARANGS